MFLLYKSSFNIIEFSSAFPHLIFILVFFAEAVNPLCNCL